MDNKNYLKIKIRKNRPIAGSVDVQYETEKAGLQDLSPDEYEQKIREICKRLNY